MINVDDNNKCREFFDKKMGQDVPADKLGDDFKGYVFRITGGFDKDGFAMKQGIFINGRLKLLLAPGAKGYRAKRTGERKRKSVRGCIVGPDIITLSVVVAKKGDKEIEGLTDTVTNKRLGPKRASGIRKLFGIQRKQVDQTEKNAKKDKKDGKDAKKTDEGEQMTALIKSKAIRRTFKSKANANAAERHKAPKIQRLVTEARLRRKELIKRAKKTNWKNNLVAVAEYRKLHSDWVEKKHKEEQKKTEEEEKKEVEKKAPAKTAPVKTVAPAKTAAPVKAPVKQVIPEPKEKRVVIENNSKEVTGAYVKAAITKTKTVVTYKEKK